jgi:hypothetical protein
LRAIEDDERNVIVDPRVT